MAQDLADKLKFDHAIIDKLIELGSKKNISMWEWEDFKNRARDLYKGD